MRAIGSTPAALPNQASEAFCHKPRKQLCGPIVMEAPMARYTLSRLTDFEVPALLSVIGLLIAMAATKAGYALWSVGVVTLLYCLHLAARCVRLGTGSTSIHSMSAGALNKNRGASIACLGPAMTMIAASAMMFGSAPSDFARPITAQTQIGNQSMPISLEQIEYCLNEERKNDQTAALGASFERQDHNSCPIDQRKI